MAGKIPPNLAKAIAAKKKKSGGKKAPAKGKGKVPPMAAKGNPFGQ